LVIYSADPSQTIGIDAILQQRCRGSRAVAPGRTSSEQRSLCAPSARSARRSSGPRVRA